MTQQTDWLIGYGSLLSQDSRDNHSDIRAHALPVHVSGWQRAWVTRSTEEKQTYVGATRAADSSTSVAINAVLMPVPHISPVLQKREQDYQFVALPFNSIDFDDASDAVEIERSGGTLWLCETLDVEPADNAHPVYQSYVDTCLTGCIDVGGYTLAERFITTTIGWEGHWINDRDNPQYPRFARVPESQQRQIDGILHAMDVLRFRQ